VDGVCALSNNYQYTISTSSTAGVPYGGVHNHNPSLPNYNMAPSTVFPPLTTWYVVNQRGVQIINGRLYIDGDQIVRFV